jgi:tetratricopeptide (TPR) repeat protein
VLGVRATRRSTVAVLAFGCGVLLGGAALWCWSAQDVERCLNELAHARASIAELERAGADEQRVEADKLRASARSGALEQHALDVALGSGVDARLRAERFAAVFREHVLDLTSGSVDDAARLWRERGDVERVAPFVDAWIESARAAGRLDRSGRLTDVLVLADPDPARTALRTALERGDIAAARAVALAPRASAATERLRGSVLRQLGMPEEALSGLRAARLFRGNDVGVLLELASCLEACGDRSAERAECLAVAAALRPSSANLLAAWAAALEGHGELERALAVCERALQIAPEHLAALDVLTRAHASADRGDEALSILRRATAAAPNDPELRWRLAAMLVAAGREREARAEFETALEVEPDHMRALQGLAQLLARSTDLAVRDERRAAELATRAAELVGR